MTTSRKPDEYDKAEGRELARLREAAGLTQEQLGVRLGISQKQVGKYERGQSRVPAGRLKAAMTILSGGSQTTSGFSEDQASFGVPASIKARWKQRIRGVVDELKFFLDEIESL